ncbi:MAG: diguanylate cyclase [Chloroflexi bacterium]|nr:diguanylate cyclase [Chloroflexota bacterium]
MQWAFTPYVLPSFLSAVISGMIAVYLWDRRSTPGAASFAAVNLAVMLWSLFGGLEMGSLDLKTKLLWIDLEYIGIVSIPVAWLFFTLEYTGRTHWLRWQNQVLFSLIPLITLVLLWTNGAHGLMRTNVYLDTLSPVPTVAKTYGGWFWVFTFYSYTLLLVGSYYLIHFLRQTSPWYSRQVIPVLASIMLPWIANLVYIFQIGALPYWDLTPVTFAISGLILGWTVFHFSLLDVVPVARSAVIDHFEEGVLILDNQNRLIDVNPAGAHILNLPPTSAVGQRIELLLARYPKLVDREIDLTAALTEVRIGEGEQHRHFELQISPFSYNKGRPDGRLIVFHDITDRKRAEQELEKSHSLLLATLEASADGILVTNLRGKTLRYNHKMVEMWALPESLLSLTDDQDRLAFIQDQLANPAAFYQVSAKLSVQPEAESYDVLELKDGRVYERYSRPLYIGEKRAGRVWSFHDITEQRKAEEKLRFLSTHDILTGLYNRVYFEEEINRLEGSRQYPISLIMADMDWLKETNDLYGHQAGDALLRRAAEILRQACRTEDMVARLGGDEFGIILPQSDHTVAEKAIGRIQKQLIPVQVGEIELPLSLSMGAATAQMGDSLRKVLRQADIAMYRKKRSRRLKRAQVNPEEAPDEADE